MSVVCLVLLGFGTQDTIEGVSVFRIDSHTMKRGEIIVDAVVKCH
jgi:hypothetical protein